MKLGIPGAVSAKIARQMLVLDKHSPTILFGTGVAGMIGSTVLACRATLKVEEVLDKAQADMKVANQMDHRDYSEEDRQNDKRIITVRTGAELVRLYGPAVILGGASIACLAQSQNILSKRNAALSAAYAALDKGFKEYRARVIEKYGEEEDRHLRYATRVERVQDENDHRKHHDVTRVDDRQDPSIYARFFDPSSPSWQPYPEHNLIFLKCQQNYANDLLRTRGHVFLNEVYDMLGIPRSKAGQVVGWIISKPTEKFTDNFIDFGIFTGDNYAARDFVNGREGSVLLDFNVDGNIYDKIDTPREAASWQQDQ